MRENKDKVSFRGPSGSKRASAIKLSKSRYKNSYLKDSSRSRSRNSSKSSRRKINYSILNKKMAKIIPNTIRDKFGHKPQEY